ncbi:hypothetical protein FC093_03245 [Ilyomonas limi]|uniref:histidine kinase n=1 Tax=Ilyomonas limi TaxID=2575867 RepID=A0A4U3LA61_9BACT|nr:ATP-binding protein [Ilyomonas limi]TKK72040.1 hypothetical protein FC093_03245 [Ilyomonas limi]
MNSFFRKLPLAGKLVLISVVPLIFLIYLSIQVYYEEVVKLSLFDSYIEKTKESENINSLINELQEERRLSFDYAMKKSGHDAVLQQRPATDSAIRQLERSNDSGLSAFSRYTFLTNLPGIRANIDTGTINADVVMYNFMTIIFRLNTLNVIPASTSSNLQPVYQDLSGQKLLSAMLTYLVIIRSNVYNVLYTHQNALGTLYGLRGSYDVMKSYETEFLLKASPQAIKQYQTLRNTSALKATINYLDTVFKHTAFDSTYTAQQWWDVSDKGTDELRTLQQQLGVTASKRIAEIYRGEQAKKNLMLVFLFLSVTVVIAIVVYTLNVINSMLKELQLAALQIAKGASGVSFREIPNDVIGSLAHSIVNIDENNKRLAEAADAIGKGNFDVAVQPRSDEDVLGNAIVRMKENLQHYALEKEKMLNMKDEFLSIASHELQTPITSMKAFLQMVERFADEKEALKPVKPLVEKATKQANKLVTITRNLLDVSRIESGRIQIDKSEFLLSEVVEDLKEQNGLLSAGHTLMIEGDTNVKLCADRLKIEQVLSNLISNAVKYSPLSDKIMISVQHNKNEVKIAVADLGIGIAKENLPFVYDRYFRIEKTSQNYPGLGLGLYISSQIIKLHHGDTGVESELGKGSTFWFTLPLEGKKSNC